MWSSSRSVPCLWTSLHSTRYEDMFWTDTHHFPHRWKADVPSALQRTLHQLRGDTATAQRARRFGMGDDDGAGCEAIIGERYCAFDIQFEAAEGFVVANRVRNVAHGLCCIIEPILHIEDSGARPVRHREISVGGH